MRVGWWVLPLVAGCKYVDLRGLNVQKYLPEVRFDTMKVKQVDFRKMKVDFRFNVRNPYPVDLKLASFDYDLALEGKPFLESASEVGLDLAAGTDSPMVLPAQVRFRDVFDLVGELRGKDEIGYGLKGSFGVDTPAGVVTVPFDETGRFPTLQAPRIEPTGLAIAGVDLLRQRATVEVEVAVTNRARQHRYGMKDFAYGLDLAGRRVASGNLADLSVEPGTTERVTIPVTLDLRQVGATLVGAITQKTPLDVRLDADLQVETPLGAIPLQVDRSANLRPR